MSAINALRAVTNECYRATADRDIARVEAADLKRRIAAALAQHPDCPHRMPCCDIIAALKGES